MHFAAAGINLWALSVKLVCILLAEGILPEGEF